MEKIPALIEIFGAPLKTWLAENNFPAYRAAQLQEWYFKRPEAQSFSELKNLPKALLEKLQDAFLFSSLTPETALIAEDGSQKNTLLLSDGLRTETVTMPMEGHKTICLSSEVGCPVMCRFCLSGRYGLKRNLTFAELCDSLRYALPKEGRESLNLVIMGMGEPFYNYENLARFLSVCLQKDSFGIGARRVTVSTVGVLEGIKKFARDFPQCNLAVSLHAPDEKQRRALIPHAPSELKDLIKELKKYFAITNRLITFEYTLLKGINDSLQDAQKLSNLLKNFPCKINLIPYNAVPNGEFEASPSQVRLAFKKALEEKGLHVTIRKSLGKDISGACGQLAHQRAQK